jgi:predicted DCC family thiol-disulfide oxidoreductase YuxK
MSQAARTDSPEVVFYDGSCGICHGFVRFVASRDDAGRFHFAPLGGTTFERSVSAIDRAKVSDSVVVLTSDQRLLLRSRAVLHVLERLGRGWWVLGRAASMVPRPLGDLVYDAVARVRRRWFAPTALASCPVVPVSLRSRFEVCSDACIGRGRIPISPLRSGAPERSRFGPGSRSARSRTTTTRCRTRCRRDGTRSRRRR